MSTRRVKSSEQALDTRTFSDPLADAFRRWGYLSADLDALERLAPCDHPDLAEASERADASDVEYWQSIYCGSIGIEFMHMIDRNRVRWVANRFENVDVPVQQDAVLETIARAELFERFLHARYVGSKRYSIEGVAGIIPLLDSILDRFVTAGGEFAVIAMSHRGRLNAMTNIVGIPAEDLFAGVEDVDPKSVLGSGDVKYHLGATGSHQTFSGDTVGVHLVSNPSHLEAVDPVLMGRVRAKQDRMGEGGVRRILPVSLHGDAAFAGQGITAETLNLAGLQDYTVGGTLHIIVNNLIGFTTEFPLFQSTRFSSDLAKRLSSPIIHVNGEDPDAIVRAGAFALDYRNEFGDDVVVDLIGYRRYGHSEVEDPSTTQPLLYKKIKDRPMLWEMYAAKLGAKQERLESLRDKVWAELEIEQEKGRKQKVRPTMRTMPGYWDAYRGGPFDDSMVVDTLVPAERLQEIAARICRVPDSFNIHPKIKRLFDKRLQMASGEKPVDWGMAEALAIGSILWDGIRVRLAGEDSRRGTFNQRHAVIIDTENGSEYWPLANLHKDQGPLSVVDSPLSEAAALGFEYGYSRDYPDALVCWEAQFGDFVNGAQTIIDQFVAAGEDKWDLLSGIVMLLPHGFEGQGPEHSSARLERSLQLAAEDNIQVCQPVLASQYFHLLRRQFLQPLRKPLIIMTPKGLLRAPAASSAIELFSQQKSYVSILPDDQITNAKKLLICSGKIYHELCAERTRRKDASTAIACVSQLYPFPSVEMSEEIRRHKDVRQCVWVQEEPANMGALRYIRPLLQRVAGDRSITTIKRSESASPATGSSRAHALEQKALIELAFA
ncbi:MAG: 2-oxoglutarate dehydrogenase E1 component [bacterium]|nr:2-oxoglutarate dehydrogenase E1 component [bacterium]